MALVKINILDGGALGSNVRVCTLLPEEHDQIDGNCNRCDKKVFSATDCERAFFSRHKYGDGHLDQAKSFVESMGK